MSCDRLGHGVFSFWLFAILGLVTRENTPLLFLGQSTTFGYISTSPYKIAGWQGSSSLSD
jgi:hypothetical protein